MRGGVKMTKLQLQKVINDNNRKITSQREMRASALIFDLAVKVCTIEGWEMADFFKAKEVK
jgi:hypothetical protein